MNMIEIKCVTDDMGKEYLPDISYTQLFSETQLCCMSKRQKQMCMLYEAIVKKENYFFHNTPTAFGNPDYMLYQGTVAGMVLGLGWEYQVKNNWICIKSGKRTIMKIQKPKRTKDYYTCRKDAASLRETLGL